MFFFLLIIIIIYKIYNITYCSTNNYVFITNKVYSFMYFLLNNNIGKLDHIKYTNTMHCLILPQYKYLLKT